MGGFELEQVRENKQGISKEQDDKSAADRFEGVSARIRTWRHLLIGIVSFLYFSGMNMGVFIISQYIYRRIQIETYPNKTFQTGVSYCAFNKSDPDVQKLAYVQQKATDFNIVFSIVAGVPSIFFNIVMGSYTDKFGRKFLILISMTGTLVRVLVCLLGVYIVMDNRLFAIGFGIEGLSGQAFAYLLASYAYISDITTSKDRAVGIVFNEVAIGLGISLPTFATGYFIQSYGFVYPLITAALFLGVAIAVTLTLLPESYPANKRQPPSQRCMNLRHSVEFYYASWNYGFRWKFTVAVLVFYLSMVTVLGRSGVETLYQLNAPFCWDPQKLGIFGALRTLLQQTLGMVCVAILKRFLQDESIAIVGCVSMAASFVIEGLAKTDTVIYIGKN